MLKFIVLSVDFTDVTFFILIFPPASLADTCPAGYYCPEQTADPIGCPEGSYSHTPGLQMESQCVNCTGGYYCNETG